MSDQLREAALTVASILEISAKNGEEEKRGNVLIATSIARDMAETLRTAALDAEPERPRFEPGVSYTITTEVKDGVTVEHIRAEPEPDFVACDEREREAYYQRRGQPVPEWRGAMPEGEFTPLPAETNEERARELVEGEAVPDRWKGVMKAVIKAALDAAEARGRPKVLARALDGSVHVEIDGEERWLVTQEWVDAAEARALKGAEHQAMSQIKPVIASDWERGWNEACRGIAAAIRARSEKEARERCSSPTSPS